MKVYPWPDRSSDPDFEVVAGDFQIAIRLQVEPPFGPGPEIPGEPQGSIGADGSLAVDDLADPERRHSQGVSEGVLR